jgi:hypothetical protein
LRLFHVGAQSGIQPAGSLSMGDVYRSWTGNGWTVSWSPWVRRSVLASDAGQDYVYAISDAGVRSARLASQPWALTRLKTVEFAPLPQY